MVEGNRSTILVHALFYSPYWFKHFPAKFLYAKEHVEGSDTVSLSILSYVINNSSLNGSIDFEQNHLRVLINT